jgi:hypothetical protein
VTRPAYAPGDGVLALDQPHLRALVDRAAGRRVDPGAALALDAAGLLAEGGVDPPVGPIVAALGGPGRRLRLASRRRGAVTVATAAVGRSGAALVVLPPGGGALHVRYLSPGGLARHLARRLGVGRLADGGGPGPPAAAEVAAWGDLVRAFGTRSPSGWASAWREAELHELRWVAEPRAQARTALVTAMLDGHLVEVGPGEGGRYVVAPADPLGVWARVRRYVSGGPGLCDGPPPPPPGRGAGPGSG